MNRAIAALMLALALPAMAQTYRWVDENGQVHYSQTPPKGQDAARVAPPPGPASAPNQDSINQALKESVESAPKEKAKAEEEARLRSEREARCRQSREHLERLDTYPAQRLLTTDAEGNTTRASEDDVAKRRAELERSVSSDCR